MNHLKIGFLFLLVSSLSACGGKLVDFDAGPGVAPTVTSTLPLNAALGVALNPSVSATFSKTMDSATLSTTTFTVKQGTTNVSGSVTLDGTTKIATFKPAAAMGNGLLYTATITTGAKDSGGLAMAANHSWTFTTAAAAAVAPTVTVTSPLDLATNVPIAVKPTATFSKAMDLATLTTSFTVKQGATSVSGTVTLDGANNTATFTPAAAMGNGQLYTATITTGAKDSGGLAMAASHSWTFTTAAAAAVPPTVTATGPLDLATNVLTTVKPTATFSKAMDSTTLSTTTFTVKQGATSVSGTVTLDGTTKIATFTPAAAMGNGLPYTATITTGAKDTSGVAMAANRSWTFTTVAVPPTITLTSPLGGATNVPVAVKPTATFSRAMDSATLTTSFTVKQGLSPVLGAVTLDTLTQIATFTPAGPLGKGLLYTATITTGAKDLGGIALAADHTWTFTTEASPPTVLSNTPVDLAIKVSINTKPTATFSKAMDPTTISTTTFTVNQGLLAVSGAVAFDELTNIATFTPDAPLGLGLPYTATISTGAKDLGGVALAADHVWTFTTDACSQLPVVLGAASNFVVLAGSTVTNTGFTSITGDLGVSPGSAVTGFPPGDVVGTQHITDLTAAAGAFDLTTAYNDAAGRTLCPVSVSGNLGGQTLAPGLYKSTGSLEISSGDLTLDAQGDGSAVFIFQMASTLQTTSGRQVILANGAKSANIFWQVGSAATLGTTSAFQGTIMADQAITLDTGASLNGRALARIGAVNLAGNAIVKPTP
jgi:hypothetical protein